MTSDSIIIITMHNTSTDTSTATITTLLLHVHVVLTSGAPTVPATGNVKMKRV